MTEVEVSYLRLDTLYEFYMYYGESKVGTILPNDNKFYFIEPNNIKYINALSESFKKFGEVINIKSVSEYRQVFKSFSSNQYFNVSDANVIKARPEFSVNANKMIILGAGASAGFHSTESRQLGERPPLSYELFEDVYEEILGKFPGATHFSSLIKSGENLEIFFQKKWDLIKAHHHPDILYQIINTQFYLQYLFRDINSRFEHIRKSNYKILCDLIFQYTVASNKQLMVTSFNYDTLFEKALENYNNSLVFNKIDDYINNENSLILFKPHGSWNWIRYFNTLSIRNEEKSDNYFSKYVYGQRMDYHQIFKQLDKTIEINNRLHVLNDKTYDNKPYLPQLLIPFTDKDEFIMPIEHRQMLENNLENINEMLVIGWKGMEAVFQNLMKLRIGDKPLKMYVVNLINDQSLQQVLKPFLPNATWIFYDSFSTFMEECRTEGHPFFE